MRLYVLLLIFISSVSSAECHKTKHGKIHVIVERQEAKLVSTCSSPVMDLQYLVIMPEFSGISIRVDDTILENMRSCYVTNKQAIWRVKIDCTSI